MGRTSRTSSVCQSAVISARRSRSSEASLGGRSGELIELFEEVGDAAALEHHAAARDLGGVRGEDGDDADAREELECGVARVAGLAEAAEGALHAAALDCFELAHCVGIALVVDEHAGAAAAFAVIGLGEVDELEVEGEGACELVRGGGIFSSGAGERAGFFETGAGGFEIAGELGLAARDAGAAKGFDLFEELVAGLLAKNLAEQSAERANVAAQRRLLGVEVARFELGEAVGPAFGSPQRGHLLIMQCRAQGRWLRAQVAALGR